MRTVACKQISTVENLRWIKLKIKANCAIYLSKETEDDRKTDRIVSFVC